ncbi:ABC transporter ATP-binding protein [uncultured Lamprocystis sp.]|jgi:ATP-binding cassette subfamily B protein|uniref:ABC transporter ATP-binding protein n=1 Tax=uncultured Lamprocystis sp. TaxID=543132 RepID=UPI0025E24E4F|nr:ABC transporter ATP-binding protein [uncultured Lamprocystis sp.]
MQLMALCALMLLATIAEVFSLGMVLPFLGVLTAPDRIFAYLSAQGVINWLGLTQPMQLLLPLTVLFTLAAVLAGVTRVALLWAQTRLGNSIGVDLGAEAFRRTLYQPYAVHLMRNSSELITSQTTKITTIVYFVIIPALTLVSSVLIGVAIILLLIWVEPTLTLATTLGLGVLYATLIQSTKKWLMENGERVAAGQSRLTRVVQEGLGGIREVLLDGLQETYLRNYQQVDSRTRRAHANITIVGGMPRPVIEALAVVSIGILAYTVAGRPNGVETALPVLGALALAAQRLLPLVQQGYFAWTSILGSRTSLGDVLRLLEQPMPDVDALRTTVPLKLEHAFEIVDVQHRYIPEGPTILRGINLKINRGDRVGFIGTTGSGKSTLLDIVMGLLTPESGYLRIDGVPVNELNRRSWQLCIAHVPQTVYLTDSSVAENIAFGVAPAEIDLERVRAAARQAQIADSIESWQNGYDTIVGERGTRLSGGQRQRIGIARALYKNADVIVFDEATSALDNETEQAVMEAINSLGLDITILIVAHRLTTLRGCDLVVELENGAIAKVGTHREMIEVAD